ncbi:MAG: cytochrome c oxidase subunit 3 [Pseudomonadota bacterium]
MSTKPESYYVPAQSYWPIVGSVALFLMAFGGASLIHESTSLYQAETNMGFLFYIGLFILLFMFWGWWRDVINESMQNLYSDQMDRSFRQGMIWFITSEIMFFAAFFGALFYVRNLVIPWLGGEGSGLMTHNILWPEFIAQWPLLLTPEGETTQAMKPTGLPLYNTIILLTSSITLTIAHHALKENNRKKLIGFTGLTVLLGLIFLTLQVEEYIHAYEDLGLTMGSGIYGSTFFLLTGFHGAHVTIGTIMLIVMTCRCAVGHFTWQNQFAYEATAWYWHFVDVVWVFLFIFVYWL